MKNGRQNADENVYAILNEVMNEHYWNLKRSGVRVSVVMVSEPGNDGGKPFLQIDEKRVLAFIRMRRLFENPKHGDAVIEIDNYLWENSLDDTGRRSLLDHELQHIALCRSKSGKLKKTLFNRPRIQLLNHDYEIGVFKNQVGRYGRKGIDFLSLALVLDQTKEIIDRYEKEEALKWLDSLPIDGLVAESSSEFSSEGAAHE